MFALELLRLLRDDNLSTQSLSTYLPGVLTQVFRMSGSQNNADSTQPSGIEGCWRFDP